MSATTTVSRKPTGRDGGPLSYFVALLFVGV